MRAFLKRRPELPLLLILSLAAYAVMGLYPQVPGSAGLSPLGAWAIVAGSFALSLLIAIVAVIGGVGGGVLFTPLLLGFTSIDTLVVRATGLVVAIFSGLVSSGPFLRRGLTDIRLIIYCAVPLTLGAMAGAKGAIRFSEAMGGTGDAAVRLGLGVILVGIALTFVLGGASTEYPEPRRRDRFSRWIRLEGSYCEESLDEQVTFKAHHALAGGLLCLGVGFVGGFFGLGGGWAVVPVLNLVMAIPLKVAAASSGVLLALGNASAVWPYLLKGALIAVFVAPWMLGQIIGGIIGAHILTHVQAGLVRRVLIVLLFLTSAKLIARGVEGLTGIAIPFL